MTTETQSLIGASSTRVHSWNAINWREAEAHVQRLQLRIAKAIKNRRYGKVESLQWLLTHEILSKVVDWDPSPPSIFPLCNLFFDFLSVFKFDPSNYLLKQSKSS
jgi:hypothetical protein